jgi:hypothetical protein
MLSLMCHVNHAEIGLALLEGPRLVNQLRSTPGALSSYSTPDPVILLSSFVGDGFSVSRKFQNFYDMRSLNVIDLEFLYTVAHVSPVSRLHEPVLNC